MNYNLQFEKLCKTVALGKIITPPQELSGGLMHRTFALATTSGKYAVKALNPMVMSRPEAMQNTINSESIVRVAANNINAITAMLFDDNAVLTIDGQHYMVFTWFDGNHIFGKDITLNHCEQMSKVLANIHNTDFSALGLKDTYTADEPIPDWNSYLQKGIATGAVWAKTMQENIELLYNYSEKVQETAKILSTQTVITHADLEPKNTLWVDDKPFIIDWEAAGFVNKYHDLVETAVYWSKDDNGKLIKEKFLAFINGYKSFNQALNTDWNMVLDKGFSGLLGWLEYSLKRSLWIECADDSENQMGTDHVSGTISNINQYAKDKVMLERWLKEVLYA